MNICGIDPGLTKGALVILSPEGKLLHKYAMPREIKDIQNLLSSFDPCYVYLELIRGFAGTSKSSMTKMMEHYGVLQASLVCCGIEYTLVPPKTWQSKIWIDSDIAFEPSTKKVGGKVVPNVTAKGHPKVDTKGTALNSAERLFPNIDLRYGDNEKVSRGRERSNVHDGLVDALLIAEYGRKQQYK